MVVFQDHGQLLRAQQGHQAPVSHIITHPEPQDSMAQQVWNSVHARHHPWELDQDNAHSLGCNLTVTATTPTNH
jgi:hypothetical protein